MYSWGSDSSASWGDGGYDYGSARNAYSSGRTYSSPSGNTSPRANGSSARTYRSGHSNVPLAKDLTTDSPYPLVVAIDVTGSMQSWPETFFEKLPLLYCEVERYLPGTEISFAAVGDAYCDDCPLQVGEFRKGKDLDDVINSLYAEGGGGGQAKESYELCAYQYARHVSMPNAKKPMFIFLGDEGFYDHIDAAHVKTYIGKDIEKNIKSLGVMRELASKYDSYIIRKEYGGDEEDTIKSQWKKALGDERVLLLDNPRRVVDTIIGVVASAAGEFQDYTTRLSQRQTSAQVSQVMSTVQPLAANNDAMMNQAVSFKKLPPGKKAKKLTP
jgi:hypothetical protein